MGKQEKLLSKFLSKPCPKNFSWNNLCTLLSRLGYEEVQGNGSRIKFINKSVTAGRLIIIHKRHPDSTLLEYQINDVITVLTEARLV